jgi:hypothetical protein
MNLYPNHRSRTRQCGRVRCVLALLVPGAWTLIVSLAYYNAGSAALVLLLIFLALGAFLWCRIRRRRLHLPLEKNNEEESIPLNSTSLGDEEEEVFRKRKGKERAHEPEGEPIFNVGELEDEDGYKDDIGSPRR